MPDLENLKKQAKLILRWHRERHYPVAAQIRGLLPRFLDIPDAEILAASFKLSAGTQSLDLSGDATANESDGAVSIEVNGAPNPRLFALLKAGPSLTIEVAGARETVPLAAAAPHVPVLEKLCLGRK